MTSLSSTSKRVLGSGSALILAGGFVVLAWQVKAPVPTATPEPTPIAETATPTPAPTTPGTTIPGITPMQPGANPLLPGQQPQNPLLPNLPAAPGTQPGAAPLPQMPPPNLQGDPKLAQLWQKGVAAQGARHWAEAIAAYRELIRAKPSAFPAHVNLALILFQQKDTKQAIWHLRQAVRLAPAEPQPRFMLAQALMMTRQPRDAFEQWTQLATMAKAKNMKPLYVQAAMSAGMLAAQELKDLPQAESWLRRANQETGGSDPRTLMTLVRILAAEKKSKEAVQLLQGAVKRFPNSPEFQSALVNAQWQAGDQNGAIATLRNLERQTPASQNNGLALAQVRVMLGRALMRRKDFDGAINAYKGATLALPKNSPAIGSAQMFLAQAYAEQAKSLEQDKKLLEAAAAWGNAAALFPKNPLAYIQRGRIYQRLNKTDEALQEYRNVLQLLPNEPESLLQAAQLEEKSGNWSQAETYWKGVIAARPTYKPAYGGLMRLSIKQHAWADQLSYMATRAAKTPNERGIYDAVLLTGQSDGKLDAARDWVESMAKKYPRASAPRDSLRTFAPPTPKATPTPVPTPVAAPTPVAGPTATPRPTTTPKPTPKPAATPTPSTDTPRMDTRPAPTPSTAPARPPVAVPQSVTPEPESRVTAPSMPGKVRP